MSESDKLAGSNGTMAGICGVGSAWPVQQRYAWLNSFGQGYGSVLTIGKVPARCSLGLCKHRRKLNIKYFRDSQQSFERWVP